MPGVYVRNDGTYGTTIDTDVTISAGTNYIELNFLTGAITTNQTGFTAGRMRLWVAVSNGSSITSVVDWRSKFVQPLSTTSAVLGTPKLEWTNSGDVIVAGTLTYTIPVAAQGAVTLMAGDGFTFYKNYTVNVAKTQITFAGLSDLPPAGTPLEFLYSNGSSSVVLGPLVNSDYSYVFGKLGTAPEWDDFLGPFSATVSKMGWAFTVTGTGATVTKVTEFSQAQGLVQLSTGTTASGNATIYLGAANACQAWGCNSSGAGTGIAPEFICLLKVPTLDDLSNTFFIIAGITTDFTTVASTKPSSGIYFEYDRAVGGLNWNVIVKSAGTENARLDTGAAVTNTYTFLWLKVTDSNGGVTARVLGSGSVVTSSAAWQNASTYGPIVHIKKKALLVARTVLVDLIGWFVPTLTARA
jgi:hypothetical protein